MPPVKGRQQTRAPARGSRRKAAPPPEPHYESVDASSVIFGLVMVFAVIVAGAALMGGSLSKVGGRLSGTMDGAAGAFGLSIADVKVVGLEDDPSLGRLVTRMSEIEPGENMFRADPHQIRRRVMATGQVTDARVYRLWPDQILIHATPAQPVALWHDGSTWQVVDSLGSIVSGAKAEDHTDLIRLSGAAATEGTPALMRALARNSGLSESLSYAERVSKRRWNLKLRNGTTIQLPADVRIDRAATQLAKLDSATGLLSRAVDRIDLRVPGKTYLKPKRSVGADSAPAES